MIVKDTNTKKQKKKNKENSSNTIKTKGID